MSYGVLNEAYGRFFRTGPDPAGAGAAVPGVADPAGELEPHAPCCRRSPGR
jgi:hypothetical protein